MFSPPIHRFLLCKKCVSCSNDFPLFANFVCVILASVDFSLSTRTPCPNDQNGNVWKDAEEWLSVTPLQVGELKETCQTLLQQLPHASSFSFGLLSATCSLRSEHLVHFLGQQWLYDSQIDAGLSLIQQNLPSSMHIAFVDTLFMTQLGLARKRHATYVPHSERAIDQALFQGRVDKLEVPVNPGGTHWAGIQVDLRARTFHYRDGFNPGKLADPQDLELLSWFLASFGVNLMPYRSTSILTPHQSDGNSCGIVLLSSLAAEHLSWRAWRQSEAAQHRVEWFIRIAEARLDTVVWLHHNYSSMRVADNNLGPRRLAAKCTLHRKWCTST